MDCTGTERCALVGITNTPAIEANRLMDTTPKARIFALAKDLGLSESYGALLHMTAAMGSESTTLVPTSEEERLTWEGHLFGLVAALHCVVMQEQRYDPDSAAEIVDIHLSKARGILQRPTSESGA